MLTHLTTAMKKNLAAPSIGIEHYEMCRRDNEPVRMTKKELFIFNCSYLIYMFFFTEFLGKYYSDNNYRDIGPRLSA